MKEFILTAGLPTEPNDEVEVEVVDETTLKELVNKAVRINAELEAKKEQLKEVADEAKDKFEVPRRKFNKYVKFTLDKNYDEIKDDLDKTAQEMDEYEIEYK